MRRLEHLIVGLLARTAGAWPLAAAMLGAALLAAGDDAWARPGGGQSFSGGGGGGGSFGGGGGDGAILYLLVWLIVRYPHIGIPLAVVVGVGWFVMNRRKGDSTTRSAIRRLERRTGPAQRADPALQARQMEELREHDPDFSPEGFLESVRNGAERLNAAWVEEDLGPVRVFLSDGVFNRFQVLLDLNRAMGVRNVMADASILDVQIAAVESDELFDTIHVRLTGQARDRDVPLDRLDRKDALLSRSPLERYVEYWSFLRRRGASSRHGGGSLEGACPNCGAPFERSDVVVCEHCSALSNSGEHGWVLAEITQQSEWSGRSSGGDVEGLAALRERDPALSRQALEDRASYLFWKWIQAAATRDGAVLERVAAPDLVESMGGPQATSGGPAFTSPAVGSVDLVACAPGEQGSRDRAFVKVRWSAVWSAGSPPTPGTQMVVLGREVGARSPEGITAFKCASCAAPLASTDTGACEYCGSPVALDETQWHLLRVARPEAVAIPVRTATDEMPGWAVPDLSDPRDRKALLARMASIMAADGVVEPRERKLLKVTARRWGVPYDQVRPVLEGRQPPVESPPTGDDEKGLFLLGLVMTALVDGRVDSRERRMIHGVASSLHLPADLPDRMIEAQKRKLKA
jgi:predicted lipid-binding transport protein (Tim44 family)